MDDYVYLARELGIQGFIQGNEYRARCPLHKDANPSFSLNIETGLWICFSGCGQGNLISLVEAVLECPLQEAYDWVLSNGKTASFDQLQRKFAQEIQQLPGQPDYLPLDMGWRQRFDSLTDAVMPIWFLNRGFTWETIRAWGVKYDSCWDAVVIPVYWEGELVGTITRNTNPAMPKYVNSPELPRSEILFGKLFTGKSEIILVEGVLDTIFLWQNGYNVAGLLGTSVSDKQLGLLKDQRFGEIILALDNDDAGKKGTLEAVRKLTKKYWLLPQVKQMKFPPDKKDPQDCSPDLFHALYLEAKANTFVFV